MSETLQNRSTETDAPPGCASFEQTMMLLDGLLSGDAQKTAQQHAAGCALCGPLAAEWTPIHDAFVRNLEDAAERAKPDLVRMPDRVFAAVAPPKKVEEPGLLDGLFGFLRGAQPWALLAATAAALALVLPAIFESKPAEPTTIAAVEPATPATPDTPADGEDGDRPVVVLRGLTFENDAQGMVYRTPRGGMTVLWVVENDGV